MASHLTAKSQSGEDTMKSYLVVHEHYWQNDEAEKENAEHTKILYVSEDLEDAYKNAEKFVELGRQARAHMEAALDIIAKKTGSRTDTSQFNDRIFLAEADEGQFEADEGEVMHIMALAAATPEMLSEVMLGHRK